MNKKKIFTVVSIFASLHLMAQKDTTKWVPVDVFAIDRNDPFHTNMLNDVVVTATKYPVKQSQTGKVITVIDKATLEKSEGKTVGEILNEQAGIEVNGALNNLGTNQTIYTRGAGSGRTLITVDGIPVGDPSLIDNGFDINLIPVDNIERIEICKGAQSTLYGSDAEAGVINIITINPNITTPFNVKATLAGGNYGTYKGNIQLYGKLAKQLIYNIRYTHFASNGFSSAYDSSGKGNFDNDGYKQDALTGNLAWTATQNLTVRGFAQYSNYTTDLDAAAFTDARDYTSGNKNIMLGGGFTYKSASTTINGNYRYNTSERSLFEDSTFGQYFYTDNFYAKTQSAEMYANTDLGHGFTLLNGADYRNASFNEHSNYGNFKDTSISQTSMYSSLFFNGKCGLNAELGGRLNTDSRYGSNYTYTFNPSFVFNNEWKIYASVASGFKAPTLYELYSPYGDPNLQPETSVNYEAGLQYSYRFINSRATFFDRNIKNGIDFDNVNFVYFNNNSEKANGIEWENNIKINKVFSLTANYTYLSEKETSQSRTDTKDTTYNYALRRPANTINASLNIKACDKFFASISVHYESKRYDAGGYDANFNPLPDLVLPSFAILNAYAEYAPTKHFKFFVDAKNITNKKFFTINGYNSIPFLINGGVMLNF
jgi:vitamin B12 transporter